MRFFKETILRIYLFGPAGSLLLLRLFPSCGERGSLLLEVCGLLGERLLSFQLLGSEAQAPSLGCTVLATPRPEAHGIFLDQGLNSRLLHWQVDSLPLSHQESPYYEF